MQAKDSTTPEVPSADHVAAGGPEQSPTEAPESGEILCQSATGKTLVPQTVLEGLLFVSGEPLTIAAIQDVVTDASPQDISRWVDLLNRSYEEAGRAVEVVEVAGGYQLVTREELSPWVEKLSASRHAYALSRSAMEALAIVAYRQPVSRSEIEQIRGVDSHAVLKTLMGRGLVRVSGRGKGPGRPLLFSTTGAFLERFGLRSLKDLPSEEEVDQLVEKSLAPSEDAAYFGRPEVR
jgi:segregation and condensation protein B